MTRKVAQFAAAAAMLAGALAAALPASAEPFKLIVTETQTPLVPNSVADLAIGLGYYKKAGVDVELVRVQQTPSAVAALRSGQGDMANIATDTALQLIARDQMDLKGVISPDKALPFLIAAKKTIATPQALEGKIFGVARVGSADYILSRAVLTKLGVPVDTLQYLAVGQPSVRGRALIAGRIDATAVSIGTWTTVPDRSQLHVLVDQQNFYRLETLASAYRKSWSVNGGLNLEEIKYTTDTDYTGPDFKDLRRVEPKSWIDTSFVDQALKQLGTERGMDETGR
jgi:NitT/TauT family transport system substrate-binding protein